MSTFSDYTLSLGMRDVINQFVLTSIDKLRPTPKYARVDSIDRINGRCGVIYNGEENPVYASVTGLWPMYLTQTVRIEGVGTDKYITGVIGPAGTNSLRPLGIVDLDTILESGLYIQRSNTNAAGGTNYPIGYAGHLEVFNDYRTTNNFILQRYTTYSASGVTAENSTQWQRGLYGTIWGPWQKVLSGANGIVSGLDTSGYINFRAASNRGLQFYDLAGNTKGRILFTTDGRIILNADEALATDARITVNQDGTLLSGANRIFPYAAAAGVANVPINAANSGSVTVALPAGRFTIAPTISYGKLGGSAVKYMPYTSAKTTTSLTIGVYASDNSTTTGTAQIEWQAIQMRPTSAAG